MLRCISPSDTKRGGNGVQQGVRPGLRRRRLQRGEQGGRQGQTAGGSIAQHGQQVLAGRQRDRYPRAAPREHGQQAQQTVRRRQIPRGYGTRQQYAGEVDDGRVADDGQGQRRQLVPNRLARRRHQRQGPGRKARRPSCQ